MQKFAICRTIEFEMAHRLTGSAGGAGSLHGHSYAADIIVEADRLDKNGMVFDFGALEEAVRGQFAVLDRHCLIEKDDAQSFGDAFEFDIVRVPYNPTAENLAKDLAVRIGGMLYEAVPGLLSISVRIHCARGEWAQFHMDVAELEDILNGVA